MRERLWSQNLYAKGTVLFKFPVIQRSHLQAYDPWLHWRSSVEQLILSSVSAPSVQASLSALTIGARNLLSSHDWRVYQRTGTSHLVAVSGLHCGIVYSLSYWLVLRVLVFFFCIRQVAMTPQITRLIALVLTYLYACLVGMSVPTQRAWLMLMWAGVPGFFCIYTPVWRRIISALVVLIFLEPVAVFKAGFWLSFSAVIWLAYVLRARIGALSAWQEFFRVSLAVNIGLLPLSMYYFHQFSLIAFLINILAVPWVTLLIVPGCVLATVMSFFSISCAHFLFHFVAFLFIPLWSILSWCADYHWVVIYTGSISLWRVVIASFGLVVFLSPLSWVVRLSSLGFLSLVI